MMRLLPSRAFSGVALAAAFAAVFAAGPAAQVRTVGPLRTAEPLRSVESVLPALAYGPACASEIELHNLSDRVVMVEMEGHRASGALVGLAGLPGTTLRLAPHQRGSYKLEIPEETTGAWVTVRERDPPGLAPAVAVSAASECVAGDQLRSVRRDVAFPQRNPWFDSDVSAVPGGLVSLINTSPLGAMARLCYSSGNLYSVPGHSQRAGELAPICSLAFDLLIPPFGAREFPVERDGNSHFSLRTLGSAIVLEMLRPLDANIKIYRVDSSIRFDADPSDAAKR
ncbi:MAG: hypothetical protein ACLQU1_38050 [Bryobacteraceae bacterium]